MAAAVAPEVVGELRLRVVGQAHRAVQDHVLAEVRQARDLLWLVEAASLFCMFVI